MTQQTAAAGTVITAFAPPQLEKRLQQASEILQAAFAHFEALVGEQFPLGYLQVAFVPPEVAPVGGLQMGLGLLLASTDLLADPLAIEQVQCSTPSDYLIIACGSSLLCAVACPRPLHVFCMPCALHM